MRDLERCTEEREGGTDESEREREAQRKEEEEEKAA
jgi:hypothetical protein